MKKELKSKLDWSDWVIRILVILGFCVVTAQITRAYDIKLITARDNMMLRQQELRLMCSELGDTVSLLAHYQDPYFLDKNDPPEGLCSVTVKNPTFLESNAYTLEQVNTIWGFIHDMNLTCKTKETK